MENPYYGIGSAISDVYKGYEEEEGRVAGQEKGAQDLEVRNLELKTMRSKAKTEQSKAAISKILQGDMEGATELLGQFGMENLGFDPETNLVSWVKDGEDHAILLPHLMASVGMNPKDLDTPEEKLGRDKELVEHKAEMSKKYGIGAGGKDSRTAYQKNIEFLMKTFTKGDPRKALELLNLSKSDPRVARTRILSDLRKANETRRRKDKWTEDDMGKMATDSVVGFQKGMFDRLIPQQDGSTAAPEQKPAINEAPDETTSPFDPNNPSALWR